jgi:hypothetical protein
MEAATAEEGKAAAAMVAAMVAALVADGVVALGLVVVVGGVAAMAGASQEVA